VLGPFSWAPWEAFPIGCAGDPGHVEQVNRLTRAYCYATGSVIRGFAGMGACRMLLPRAFIDHEPVFTVSDRAWRRALKLTPDELTLVTPPVHLITMLQNLEASH